jgi:hypothetical protein
MRTSLFALVAVAALLATAGVASGFSVPFNTTKKIAARACNSTAGCINWSARCKPTNRQGKTRCKATNFYEDGGTCLIGVTFARVGSKVRLINIGQPQCY